MKISKERKERERDKVSEREIMKVKDKIVNVQLRT